MTLIRSHKPALSLTLVNLYNQTKDDAINEHKLDKSFTPHFFRVD